MFNSFLHSANSDIKYPLEDIHEEDISNNLLIDLSISVPEGEPVVLAVARVEDGFVFLSFERETSKEPVATFYMQNPSAGIIYSLSMDVEGFGYLVLGSFVLSEEYNRTDLSIRIEEECILPVKEVSPVFNLTVNGIQKTLKNILQLVSTADFLSITIENGVIYLDRIDENLSARDLASLTSSDLNAPGIVDSLIYTVAGISPDANGNVDIDVEGCIPDCERDYSLTVPRGDIGEGVRGELPLDIYNDRDPSEDPCNSVPGLPPDPEPSCLPVTQEPLIDPATSAAVGTVYRTPAPEPPNTFDFRIDTTQPGDSGADQFTLPLNTLTPSGYNFTVYWGDDTQDVITVHNQAEITHTYPAPGQYDVVIEGTISGWTFALGKDSKKMVEITKFGPLDLNGPGAFAGCQNMTITATDSFTVSTNDLTGTFRECYSVTDIPGLTGCDVSGVEIMDLFFLDCYVYDGDLSWWPLDMLNSSFAMFQNCLVFTGKGLHTWTLPNFTGSMRQMFLNDALLNVNISGWQAAPSTLFGTFQNCVLQNSPLTNLDTSNCTSMHSTFRNSAQDQDMGGLDWTACTEADNFLLLSQMSVANYSATLIGIEAQAVQDNVNFHGGTSQYNVSAATARTSLQNDHSWVISDGGPE